jgi:DNA-binding transcriptional LysR family regulator
MDKIESIRTFARVVEEGSFVAAARSLGVTRSAVSKHIRALEDELGAQLFRRSTRRVSPTDTGLAFYDRALVVLAEMDAALLAVGRSQGEARGRLRVNAPMSFGTLHLSRAVADFMAEFPELEVELSLSDRMVDPIEEGFDVTIRVARPRHATSLVMRQLAPARRVLCASPSYLEIAGEPLHPRDLAGHRCLHYGYLETGSTWPLSGPDGEHATRIRCVMWSNNGEVLKDAALAGQGIAMLPTFIVGPDLQQGRLRTVLCDYRPPDTWICALYPRHRHLAAKVRLFVDHVSRRFTDRPYWDLVE